MTIDAIALNVVLFVLLALAIRTLMLQIYGYRQYHKMLVEVHKYNLIKISHNAEKEIIHYSDLPHYPMFFTTAKAHKIRLLSNAIKSESSVQFEDDNTNNIASEKLLVDESTDGRNIVGE